MSSGPDRAAASPTRALPLLKGAYALALRAGLFERAWFRRVYSRAYFAYKRRIEDPFAGLLARRPELVRAGDVADVGAHIGYTAAVFCAGLDPGRRVFAFEPDAANAALLAENLAPEIARGSVVPVVAAVGRAPGTADLVRNPVHPGDHRIGQPGEAAGEGRERVRVPVVSLDDFFQSREGAALAFVKLDVQGFEIEVCRGMTRLLERERVPWIAVEHSPAECRALGFDPELVPAFLRERGYSLQLLCHDGSSQPWPSPRADALLARRGYIDLLAGR